MPENKCTVAINSYYGSGGGGHLENGAGVPRSDFAARLINSTERDLRHYLLKWIEEKGINNYLMPGKQFTLLF